MKRQAFMKIDHIVAGSMAIAFTALLPADAILTTVDLDSMLFSTNDDEGRVVRF